MLSASVDGLVAVHDVAKSFNDDDVFMVRTVPVNDRQQLTAQQQIQEQQIWNAIVAHASALQCTESYVCSPELSMHGFLVCLATLVLTWPHTPAVLCVLNPCPFVQRVNHEAHLSDEVKGC